MIFVAFLHMFTVYFTQAYRPPREMTWFSGIAIMGITLTFGFSGYLLPWNELSFFATRVGTGMMHAIPFFGDYLLVILRGGEEVTGATIGRFFGLHVAILPAMFTAVLGLHLLFVQRQGMSEPVKWQSGPQTKKRYMKFFPNFMYRDILLWLVFLNLLALLAVIFPDGFGVIKWPLGIKADPFSPPPDAIRPEWYFMFAFQALKLLPAKVLFIEGEQFGLILITLGGLAWLLVPIIDKKSRRNERSPLGMAFGILVVAFLLFMTIMGYLIK
jgi:cytochrome b6